jgi:hypothetical protein
MKILNLSKVLGFTLLTLFCVTISSQASVVNTKPVEVVKEKITVENEKTNSVVLKAKSIKDAYKIVKKVNKKLDIKSISIVSNTSKESLSKKVYKFSDKIKNVTGISPKVINNDVEGDSKKISGEVIIEGEIWGVKFKITIKFEF